MNKIKEFFSKKNIFLIFLVLFLILIVIFVYLFCDVDKKFMLNSIYNVYPKEVRALYSNMVEVSCYGDLHLDISLDTGTVDLKKMKESNLIDYLFSYLDKKNKLTDEIPIDLFIESSDRLFADKLDLTKYIKDYKYGKYVYNLKGGIITRVPDDSKCSKDLNYISHLYGYSYNDKLLSVDVDIGYLKDDILFNLTNENLGKYNGDLKSLSNMFHGSSYYRYNFIKDGNDYKLQSVEWNVRY